MEEKNIDPGSAQHLEDVHPSDDIHGFTATESSVPKGYFYSPFFLGTMMATGLGLGAAVGGFGLAAPNLPLINNDIGPDPNIFWVSLVYTLTLAIGLLLVGRLSDLFGRRVSWASRVYEWTILTLYAVVLYRLSRACVNRLHRLCSCEERRNTYWRHDLDRACGLRPTVICLHHGRDRPNEGMYSLLMRIETTTHNLSIVLLQMASCTFSSSLLRLLGRLCLKLLYCILQRAGDGKLRL